MLHGTKYGLRTKIHFWKCFIRLLALSLLQTVLHAAIHADLLHLFAYICRSANLFSAEYYHARFCYLAVPLRQWLLAWQKMSDFWVTLTTTSLQIYKEEEFMTLIKLKRQVWVLLLSGMQSMSGLGQNRAVVSAVNFHWKLLEKSKSLWQKHKTSRLKA